MVVESVGEEVLEEPLKMCKKAADPLGHLLARAAAKNRRATGDNVDRLAVLVLDLHVGGEQRDLFLGRLVEPEAQDAPARGDADRGNGLAGNGELAPGLVTGCNNMEYGRPGG
eukprot:scaffold3607_cov114-Isochrysis_galbana.AAC.30